MEHTSKRFTLVDKDTYRVDLEYSKYFAILHLPYVKDFTVANYLDMLKHFESFKEFIYTMGYRNIWIASKEPKILRLVTRIGFQCKGSADGLFVYSYEELK